MKTVKSDAQKNRRALIVLCACMPVLVILLDQLSKYIVRTLLEVGDSVSVIGEFMRITYVLNSGMAFGMGGGWRWVFMIFTPIALTAVAVVFFKKFNSLRPLTLVSLTMIFGGGLSNMIDRIFFYHLDPSSSGLFDGRVVDFLDFNITLFGKRVWNAVFNIADAFVVVGVFILAITLIVSEIGDRKKKKAGECIARDVAAGDAAGSEDATGSEGATGSEDATGSEGDQGAEIGGDAGDGE